MIQLANISLYFGPRTIFENVTLVVRPGEKAGLIGRNGSGKSTLLNLMAGKLKPQNGQVDLPSGFEIGYLPQTVDLDPHMTPRDICNSAFGDVVQTESAIREVQNALEQSTDAAEQMTLSGKLSGLYEKLQLMGAAQMAEAVEKVLKGMGFDLPQMDQPIKQLSGGWKMRVELARLLLLQPDLLLLDEPTNHLDIESILWFEQHMRSYEGAVLIVSHDQHVLNNVTHRTIEISGGGIYDYPFAYSEAMERKKEREEVTLNAYANQQREIAHKERLIDKFRAKASKAKFAKALQSELDRMDVIEPETTDDKTMRLTFAEGARAGRVVFAAKNLNKAFGETQVIRSLNLEIERGERIAFVGQNGQGKTTLARMMAGEIEPSSGKLIHGHQLQIGYYAQNQTDLLTGSRTVLETLQHVARGETEGRLRSLLGALLFEGDEVTKKVSVLSGGEKARLSFACMVVNPSNVLILDEPTNHLDIPSKEILKRALMDYHGTLIVVSHDLDFLQGLTTHTLEFRAGRIVKHLSDIDEFLEMRKIDDMRTLERTTDQTGKISDRPEKTSDSTTRRNLRKEIRSLEQKISKLESRKRILEKEMGAPDFYERNDIVEVTRHYDQLCAQIEELMTAWENMSMEIGE